MKVLVTLLVVAICYVQADLTPEQLDKVQNMLKECKAKTDVTDEDVALLMQHKVPEKESGKCFSACLQKRIGILDADNKVDLARVKELMDKIKDKIEGKYDVIMKVAETCAAEVPGGANECEVSGKLMECCIREMKGADVKVDFMSLISS